MATNKELNEKVDKLTEMFQTFLKTQSVKEIEEKVVVKQRGRPRGNRKNAIIADDFTSEPQIARKRRSNWENSFIDDGTEALEEKRADELIKAASPPPVPKGGRRPAIIRSSCSDCGKVEDVPKQFVMSDPESKERYHTCQKCLKNKVGK